MSYVTDVVFITPRHVKSGAAGKRFQELYTTLYTRYGPGQECEPVEDNGAKCSGTQVFHMGINYMDQELLEALQNEPWPKGTVLYIFPEDGDYWNGPEAEIKTW